MRNYRIRTKYRIAIFLWFLIGPALLFGTHMSQYFFIPLFILFIVLGLYAVLLKCPECGKSVLNNPIRVFGTEFYIWTCWIPKKCTRCGIELK